MKIIFNIDDNLALEHWPPVPTKDYLPEWYSKLPLPKDSYEFNEIAIQNVRACVPVGDFLTSGYILKTTYEFRVIEKIINFVPKMSIHTAKPDARPSQLGENKAKPDKIQGIHPQDPVGIYSETMCPMRSQDKKRLGNYFKFESEWSIRTPPGYSCLVMQPYYLFNQDVNIMPAIIDTDTYDKHIPVAGFLTGNAEEVRFVAGDPLLQIIPFKRDNWEAEFTTNPILNKSKFFLYNAYKRIFHSPKRFK
jgi:hypothetical protein